MLSSPLEHLAAFGICFILGAGTALGLKAYKLSLEKKLAVKQAT